MTKVLLLWLRNFYIFCCWSGSVLRWAGGTCPRFTCCPQIQKLPDRSDVLFWRPKMLQNPNFPLGHLQRSRRPHSWRGCGSLPRPQEPHPVLGPSGLVSTGLSLSGLTHFKCRPIWSSYFFSFGEGRICMDSVMKELMGQCPRPELLG